MPVELHAGNQAWSADLPGPGSSSPVVWGNRLFVTAEDREKGEIYLVAFDAGTGRRLWMRTETVGEYHLHRFNNTAAATPCLTDEFVIFAWYDAARAAVMLSAYTHGGQRAWERNLGPWKGQHGPSENVVAAGGKVIVPHLHMGGGYVGAFAVNDGAPLWQVEYPGGSKTTYATPLIRKVGRDASRHEVVISGTSIGVWALDLETGKKNWTLPGIFPQRTIVSPVEIFRDPDTGASLIQVGCKSGNFFAVRPPPASGKKGSVAWKIEKHDPYVPNPVSDGKTLYVLSDGGVLTAVEARTGARRWQENLEANFYASPLLVGGHLYCLSREGEMQVAEVAPKFKLLARTDLQPGDEVEWTDATPAVANGSLYVRLGARLDCYRTPQP
ncbi:MAG: PQQ-binding-like beta-propeller repeat protein [Akkermansiaceae bacterium]|nr:PQQ-binding-like beta-propeller repeat protein [Akkermansiaceae bacterium]